jgi:hypothetical protein
MEESTNVLAEDDKVRNVIRDTRRDIKFIIWADRKLDREEMLKEIKKFNYTTANIRQKSGATIELRV